MQDAKQTLYKTGRTMDMDRFFIWQSFSHRTLVFDSLFPSFLHPKPFLRRFGRQPPYSVYHTLHTVRERWSLSFDLYRFSQAIAMSSAATNATTAPVTGAGAAAAGAGGQAISSDEMLGLQRGSRPPPPCRNFRPCSSSARARLAQFYQRMAKWAFSSGMFRTRVGFTTAGYIRLCWDRPRKRVSKATAGLQTTPTFLTPVLSTVNVLTTKASPLLIMCHPTLPRARDSYALS